MRQIPGKFQQEPIGHPAINEPDIRQTVQPTGKPTEEPLDYGMDIQRNTSAAVPKMSGAIGLCGSVAVGAFFSISLFAM